MISSNFAQRLIVAMLGIAVLASVLSNCKTQKDKTTGITGSISVDGGSPDGATISVYRRPGSFPANSAWGIATRSAQGSLGPIVGFAYSPAAAFDWRNESSITTTNARSDGAFTVSDLVDGDYILVARKDSFGWTSPISLSVRGQNLDLGTLHLYRESSVPDTATNGDRLWRAGHHYVLDRDYTLEAGQRLIVEPGAVIRVRNESRINIAGAMICEGTPDSFITFTCEAPDFFPSSWEDINVQESADAPLRFRYTRFEYGVDAIRSADLRPDAVIEYCYFGKLFNLAMDLSGSENMRIAHNVIDSVDTGTRAFQCNGITIEHNLFYRCSQYAIQLDGGQIGAFGDSLYCNWFYACGANDSFGQAGTIYMSNLHDLLVAHNNVEGSVYALNLGSKVDSTVIINRNRFAGCFGVLNVGSTPQAYGASYPIFQSNHLESNTKFCISIGACEHNVRNIVASNNFWLDSQGHQISPPDVITDGSDHDHAGCGLVLYLPVATGSPTSGLCNAN